MSVNYFNRFKLKSLSAIALFITALFCFFSSCSDDTFSSFYNRDEDSPYIRFEIIDGSAAAARSGEEESYDNITNIYTLTSEEGDTIFLIQSETEGIMLDSAKTSVASRGEMINNVEKLDTLGLYGFRSPKEGEMPSTDTELFFDHWKLVKKGDAVNNISHPALCDNDGTEHPDELWPNYQLDFVAYYPYAPSYRNEEDTELGIDYKDGLYGWM